VVTEPADGPAIPGRGRTGAMIAVVRRLVRVVCVLAASVAVLLVDAAPAWAHGVSGLQPTNYRTTVRGLDPPIRGVSVRAVDLGGKLELTNRSGTDVVVLGYQNEPYLRVGPDGVFENVKSPAVFLNRTTIPTATPPRSFDASARPVWRRVSSGDRVRWHDHRAHWMGPGSPPEVQRDPASRHVVIRDWRVPLVSGGHRVEIAGDVVWVPGPSVWPWALGAIAIAVVVVVASRTRSWRVALSVALALLVAGEAVHIAGLWGASTAANVSKAGSSVYSVAGCLVGIGALFMLRRRDPYDATPVVLIASVFLLIAGGFADVTSLTRSQLPSTLPEPLARGVVMSALGLGGGLVIASATRLRRPMSPPSRTSRTSRTARTKRPPAAGTSGARDGGERATAPGRP
jgi:hypothetical protein